MGFSLDTLSQSLTSSIRRRLISLNVISKNHIRSYVVYRKNSENRTEENVFRWKMKAAQDNSVSKAGRDGWWSNGAVKSIGIEKRLKSADLKSARPKQSVAVHQYTT